MKLRKIIMPLFAFSLVFTGCSRIPKFEDEDITFEYGEKIYQQDLRDLITNPDLVPESTVFKVDGKNFDEEEKPLNKIPFYSELCCGTGLFVDDQIEDYIVIPDKMTKKGHEYFANFASGDSMIGKGIKDGDIIIFEKTNILENGDIGSFCIDDGNCVCKIFRRLPNGMIILESANDKYDPIPVDVTNECFRIIGKYVGMIRIG